MSSKDRLFADAAGQPDDFVFDERVVRVFPDMINRSIPGYALVVQLTGLLAGRYVQNDSVLYDLGCSLGASTLAMQQAVRGRNVRIVAVDNSAAMVAQLRKRLASRAASSGVSIEVVCRNAEEVRIENASVVVMNFTLQFVEPSVRLQLLRTIANGLLPGGVLLISEKIHHEDTDEQSLQTTWHHDFKRAQGYSELEIARKRDALEHIMKTDSLVRHRERLLEAGFQQVQPWFQCFSFVSLAAFR